MWHPLSVPREWPSPSAPREVAGCAAIVGPFVWTVCRAVLCGMWAIGAVRGCEPLVLRGSWFRPLAPSSKGSSQRAPPKRLRDSRPGACAANLGAFHSCLARKLGSFWSTAAMCARVASKMFGVIWSPLSRLSIRLCSPKRRSRSVVCVFSCGWFATSAVRLRIGVPACVTVCSSTSSGMFVVSWNHVCTFALASLQLLFSSSGV